MRPQHSEAVEIFCSYAHRDEPLRQKLQAHLSQLTRDGKIKSWHDRLIRPGENWKDRIDEQLETADLILLLVSADFINSDYCHEIEMRRALERHHAGEARAVPVILRRCDWETSRLSELQALPAGARPVVEWEFEDAAFTDIAKGIRTVVDELLGLTTEESKLAGSPSTFIPRPPVVGFVARRDEGGHDIVASLTTELAPGRGQFVALCGPGGVGKTTLAAETARALSAAFAHRVAWVSADGRPDFSLTTLLDEVAGQFGQTGLRPLPVVQKAERVRALVAQQPALLVLDNFETITPEEQTRCAEWLGGCASCSAIVTSRINVPRARHVYIRVMTPTEAKELLEQLVGQTRNPHVFASLDHDHIINAAGRIPLVLQWVITQIDRAQEPRAVLNELVKGKGDAAKRVFDRSFDLLDEDGRASLLALSLFAPSASRPALLEVSGCAGDEGRLNKAVAQLADWWLVGVTESGERLQVEGLTRELSKSRLAASDHAGDFLSRFVSHFLNYAEAHAQPTPEDLAALEEEKDNLLGAMDVAFQMKNWDGVMRIRIALEHFLDLRGYWNEAIQRGEQAMAAAQEANDEWAVAQFAGNAAKIRLSRGEYDEAKRVYQQALTAFRKLESDKGVAACLHNLAFIAHNQGELNEAQRLYDESLQIKKKLDDQNGIANTLHQLAMLARDRGELDEAGRLYNESLEIRKMLDDQRGIALTLGELGNLAYKQGNLAEARRLYDESLVISKELGDRSSIAASFGQLGRLAEEEGNKKEAARLYREALSIFERLKSPYAELARGDLKRVAGESS